MSPAEVFVTGIRIYTKIVLDCLIVMVLFNWGSKGKDMEFQSEQDYVTGMR